MASKSNKYRVITGILLLILLIFFPFLKVIQNYLAIPTSIVTFQDNDVLEVISQPNNQNGVHTFTGIDMTSAGDNEVILKKGNIPIKKMDLSILKNKQVIPGGQSVGVQLNTVGVLVVGHHLVHTENETESPGEEANIQVGDMIIKMNDQNIEKVGDVKPIVQKAGDDKTNIKVQLKRGSKTIKTTLKPVKSKQNKYQIGLYIKDSATGIGTISFYDLETKKYGALGHIISDNDTKKPIELHKGKIVRSIVESIEKGNQGFPGEKRASFSVKDKPLGTVTKNSPFGIFGKLNTDLLDDVSNNKPLQIGLSHEVKKGPAKILTVVDGDKVEQFDIEIVNSIPQKHPATKGMVIKVTDEQLLQTTGGIIQGMSGSPIIQDGKLIGAVTHVFVNDPTSGYGVHIEWMLQEAGIDLEYDEQTIAS